MQSGCPTTARFSAFVGEGQFGIDGVARFVRAHATCIDTGARDRDAGGFDSDADSQAPSVQWDDCGPAASRSADGVADDASRLRRVRVHSGVSRPVVSVTDEYDIWEYVQDGVMEQFSYGAVVPLGVDCAKVGRVSARGHV